MSEQRGGYRSASSASSSWCTSSFSSSSNSSSSSSSSHKNVPAQQNPPPSSHDRWFTLSAPHTRDPAQLREIWHRQQATSQHVDQQERSNSILRAPSGPHRARSVLLVRSEREIQKLVERMDILLQEDDIVGLEKCLVELQEIDVDEHDALPFLEAVELISSPAVMREALREALEELAAMEANFRSSVVVDTVDRGRVEDGGGGGDEGDGGRSRRSSEGGDSRAAEGAADGRGGDDDLPREEGRRHGKHLAMKRLWNLRLWAVEMQMERDGELAELLTFAEDVARTAFRTDFRHALQEDESEHQGMGLALHEDIRACPIVRSAGEWRGFPAATGPDGTALPEDRRTWSSMGGAASSPVAVLRSASETAIRAAALSIQKKQTKKKLSDVLVFPRSFQNGSAQAKLVDADTMLSWQNTRILEPLSKTIEENSAWDCALCVFRNIQSFMHDRPCSDTSRPAIATDIVVACHGFPSMSDEIWLQLVKQLNGNPRRSSELMGWKLALHLAQCGCYPSDMFLDYVRTFVYKILDRERGGTFENETTREEDGGSRGTVVDHDHDEDATARRRSERNSELREETTFVSQKLLEILSSDAITAHTQKKTRHQRKVRTITGGQPVADTALRVHLMTGRTMRMSLDDPGLTLKDLSFRVARKLNIRTKLGEFGFFRTAKGELDRGAKLLPEDVNCFDLVLRWRTEARKLKAAVRGGGDGGPSGGRTGGAGGQNGGGQVVVPPGGADTTTATSTTVGPRASGGGGGGGSSSVARKETTEDAAANKHPKFVLLWKRRYLDPHEPLPPTDPRFVELTFAQALAEYRRYPLAEKPNHLVDVAAALLLSVPDAVLSEQKKPSKIFFAKKMKLDLAKLLPAGVVNRDTVFQDDFSDAEWRDRILDRYQTVYRVFEEEPQTVRIGRGLYSFWRNLRLYGGHYWPVRQRLKDTAMDSVKLCGRPDKTCYVQLCWDGQLVDRVAC